MPNPTVIFSMGSRVFKNSESLNEPPAPLDCSDYCEREGYVSRYNPKTHACECVKINNFAIDCAALAQETEESLGNYRQDNRCCCSCPDTIRSDCTSRGWRYITASNNIIFGGNRFDGCKCDCRENFRLNNNDTFYISENECPLLNGVSVWNEYLCECECDKLPYFNGCSEPYIVGANCQCVCDPNSIPESGCPIDSKGRQGIFSYASCKCIYPCEAGSIPVACRKGGPYSEVTITCIEPCGENEYLTPCDSKGFRHCCENGSIWIENPPPGQPNCQPCERYQPTCDNPNKINYRTCSCCPDGKIYDYGNNEFNLYGGECVCESVTDIYSDTTIPTNDCVEPRFITDDCECKCPDNKIWGRSPQYPHNFECLDIIDRCPEYDENGDIVGPVNEFGEPLYTRWDSANLECECYKGNEFINICVNYDKFLNTETCECDCPQGSSRIQDTDETDYDSILCACEPNKVVAVSIFDTEDILGRQECLTCQEIHGIHAVYQPFEDGIRYGRNYGTCECDEGYTKEKEIFADDVLRAQCVSCASYTDNAIWNPQTKECDCANGFEKIFDNENKHFDCVLIDTPITTPTTEPTTTTPLIEEPTPTPTPDVSALCYCRHTIANPGCDACPPGYVISGEEPCVCVFTSEPHPCFSEQPLQVCIDKAIEAAGGNGLFEQDVPL